MLRNNWVVSGIFLTGILRLNLKRREIWNFEQAVSKIFPCETCTFFVSTVFQSFRTEVGFASIKLVLHTTMRHSIKYWSIFFSELIVSAEFIWQEIQGVENWKKKPFPLLIPHSALYIQSFFVSHWVVSCQFFPLLLFKTRIYSLAQWDESVGVEN